MVRGSLFFSKQTEAQTPTAVPIWDEVGGWEKLAEARLVADMCSPAKSRFLILLENNARRGISKGCGRAILPRGDQSKDSETSRG